MKKIMILANNTTYTYNLRDVLLKSFLSEGYEVVVVCECLKFEKELSELGIRLVDMKMNRRSKNPFSDLGLLGKFIRIIRQEKPDIVLTYNIKPNVYGGVASALAHIPYISNITGLGTAVENAGIVRAISTALYKIGVSKAACVMFQNEVNLHFFTDRGLLGKSSRVRLLPGSGVNLDKFSFQPYPAQTSPVIFSVIGRIMKDKGTDEFLEAARIVREKHPHVRFRVIGSFDENYQALIHSAVSEGLIEYIDEQEDVRPFVKESWAIIQPSHHEGMSNVLLESASMGRPVIASDIPGCREAFDESISGLSFRVGDSKALADAISGFIGLPYEAKLAMSAAGRDKMERNFDRRIVANIYLDEIRKVLGIHDDSQAQQ